MSGIPQRISLFVPLKGLIDAIVPLLALSVVLSVPGAEWGGCHLVVAILGGAFLSAANSAVGTSRHWRAFSPGKAVRMELFSWGVTLVMLAGMGRFFGRIEGCLDALMLSWAFMTPFMVIAIAFFGCLVLREAFRKGLLLKRIALVGSPQGCHRMASVFGGAISGEYRITGVYLDTPDTMPDREGMVVRALHDAVGDAKDGRYDECWLCPSFGEEKPFLELIDKLSQTTVVVRYAPNFHAFALLRAEWSDINGQPLIGLYDTPMSSLGARMLKRFEDILLSGIILAVISPLVLAIALAVKLSSPGPVFYRQTRVSWNGRPFTIFKFRSMPVDTEKGSVVWGNADRKTTTSFGRFIRSKSLDELPQFINVLKGDMSIVGPRPERDIFIDEISREIPRYMQRHMVKAGITGWAQINGFRGDTSLRKRVEHDLYYINNWSLWLDLQIILRTAVGGWSDRKAGAARQRSQRPILNPPAP